MKLDNLGVIYVPLYIIILIVAIPQLSETIYVPSLPDMAKYFNISASIAEFTLTIYLLGFAFGVLIWGNLSDSYGRKPCIVAGLVIYIIACYGCYSSNNIELFLISRFVMAFGASVGSVLGQAIARDAIKPEARGKMFSMVSIAMAFAPAIGPIIGGFVAYYYAWNMVFIALILLAGFTISLIIIKLPETNPNISKKPDVISLYQKCFTKMIKDHKILGYAFMVGAVNGILFGYFAEAPFYFTNNLNVSSSDFGLISFFICVPLALGGTISKNMHKRNIIGNKIIYKGIILMNISAILFLTSTYLNLISSTNSMLAIMQTLLWLGIIITGITMIIPNCLSAALEDYGNFAGTAASLFGFMYYIIIAGFTWLMSMLHNGELIQLPTFLLITSILMLLVFNITLKKFSLIKIEQVNARKPV